jgi:hypothetical protein
MPGFFPAAAGDLPAGVKLGFSSSRIAGRKRFNPDEPHA